MYFWNVKKLTSELKKNKVSEIEKLKYFAVMILLWVIVFYMVALYPYQVIDKPSYIVVSMVAVMLTGMGLYSCFQANQEGDGKDFISRFVCLSLPINIRLMVLFFLVFAAGVGINFALQLFSKSGVDFFINSLTIPATLFEYLWIRKYIKLVAQ